MKITLRDMKKKRSTDRFGFNVDRDIELQLGSTLQDLVKIAYRGEKTTFWKVLVDGFWYEHDQWSRVLLKDGDSFMFSKHDNNCEYY